MNDRSYIKISRKILEWEWYQDINTKLVFLHMLLKANWRDGKFQGTTVPRGSFVSSINKLSYELSLTEREIRTAITHLKTTGEVTSKSTNKYTVFTVINYGLYQTTDKQTDNQETGGRHSNDILTTTIEEEKEKKEGKKDNIHYQQVADLYNSTCVSLPRIRTLSNDRKKAIRARLRTYSISDFETLFRKAEASEFLKGSSGSDWSADFDWLIKDRNMPKVLEGKYDNEGGKGNGPLGGGTGTDEKGFVAEAIAAGIDTDCTGIFDGY